VRERREKREKRGGKRGRCIVVVVNRLERGLEVLMRALWCKARGGGGRLRHATGRMKKENVRWVMAMIKAKAVAVASACLIYILE